MPSCKWDAFLEWAPFAEPPVYIVSPPVGASDKTTHLGNNTPNVTVRAFVNICVMADILPSDLDFGRAGPGCGPVPLKQAALDTSCVLGASELGLGSHGAMLRYPVLRALNEIFENTGEDDGTIVIVDFK